MKLLTIYRLLRKRNLLAQLQLLQDWKSFTRFHFLHAAMESHLLEALTTPTTKQQLIQKLNIHRPELLDPLLDLGVSLGELSYSRGRYRVRGQRSKALVSKTGDPLAALVEEGVTYHASVYRHLTVRMSGAPLGNYLDGMGNMIARSSRVLEPFIADFARSIAATGSPIRLLEVGCGSGIYLRYAAQANPHLTGVGIDLQKEVVKHAEANLRRWGLAARFKIVAGDIRNPPSDLPGPFDLITLYNNIYYFTPDERPVLLHTLNSLLAPNGKLAVVTLVQGNTPASADFDLVLRSTIGCAPLPEKDAFITLLRESRFHAVTSTKLMPFEPLYGFVATRSRQANMYHEDRQQA